MAEITQVVAQRVVKTFGATAALRGVDVKLEAGGLTIIEGPNGSGKTTLLRILGTILRPTSGTVSYHPLEGLDEHAVRAEVGWVSHETLAYGELSGRANIALAAKLYGMDPEQAWATAKERFGLRRFADRPLNTNSRGQRQRVALARGLLHSPSLLLLDEPTTGLDRSGVGLLLKLIEAQLGMATIIVVVSHEPELFTELANSRIVLERGKIARVVTAPCE